MKNKKKEFTFLDPASVQVRHSRVQFMLTVEEYDVLKAAASIQSTKAGDLAGVLFRKHILPGLSEEVQRLHKEVSGNSLERSENTSHIRSQPAASQEVSDPPIKPAAGFLSSPDQGIHA